MNVDVKRNLLITDLDNTLWDWFDAWYESFSALLLGLTQITGIDQKTLESEIKSVHRLRGTTEYSNLVNEVPCLKQFAQKKRQRCASLYDSALHAQSKARIKHTKLYPGVIETLKCLKENGFRIVAYTESGAFWTRWRIKRTGLDGLIDVLYSAPDHDLVAGVRLDQLRTGKYTNESYELEHTKICETKIDRFKPNSEILKKIMDEQGRKPEECAYLGDSLMKDIAMAQESGVLDIHAAYGEAQKKEEYDLLRRVTHWSDETVKREKELSAGKRIVIPNYTCKESISEIIPILVAGEQTGSKS